MRKILFISNISNKISSFAFSSIFAAKELNLLFYQAANWSEAADNQIEIDENHYGIKIFNVPIARSPFSKENITAYKQIVKIIKDENIDYIHCNTPVGGLLGRLAGKKCNVQKVIYQAHGFHFYKGASKKNWLIYYPIEKWLAHYTDAIITINKEDYEAAQKFKLKKGGKVYYVPGVGINTNEFAPHDTEVGKQKRKELGIPEDAVTLISAGELNQNKNNSVIISALAKCKNKNIHYILCGVGPLEEQLKYQAEKLELQDRVHFLGYRTDIKELFAAADVFVMPSFREGLSRSIMEAMASGLPCIVSKIRGNVDLIIEGEGGFLCSPTSAEAFAEAIDNFCSNSEFKEKMRVFNLEYVKNFEISVVEKELLDIYEEVLK